MMEFGDDQNVALQEIFTPPFWGIESVEKDDTGRPRFLIARRE